MAIEELTIVLRYKPKDADAHYNLGSAYYKKGMLDKAIMEYEKTLKINPDHAEAHYNLGLIYLKLTRINEAIVKFSTALKLNPALTDARQNLENAHAIKSGMKEFPAEQELQKSPPTHLTSP